MRATFEVVLAILLAAGAAWAQQPGPLRPPEEPPRIHRIPLHPEVVPPPLPPEQIVQRFVANETKYRDVYEKYGYLETIRVEELGGRNGASGSYAIEVEVYLKPDGKRYERVLKRSKSTLQYLQLSMADLEVLAEMPRFPLAGDAAANYNFTYRGTEKLDELETYAFRVEPKKVEPGHSYFSGVVWVDNQDLAIVKSYGQFISSEPRPPNSLPFTFFETYRENAEGKYWFPSYIRSDEVLTKNQAELPIRLIVRATDFHPGQPAAPAAKPLPPTSH
jgi:hypothetical protein